MTADFIAGTKQIGDAIINMSALLDSKLEKWSDATSRPDNLTARECAGYINKETADTGMTFVVDVQAPEATHQAALRIWAIESRHEGPVERFNNIQLDFEADYDRAAAVAQKAGEATREDIRAVLQDPNTHLVRLIVSNLAGRDASTQQTLGERYDLSREELEGDADVAAKALATAQEVLTVLKNSTTAESNS